MMAERPADHEEAPAGDARFMTTRWSIVLSANDSAAPEAFDALESLCAAYWYPLYAWLRRQGYHVHDAQDLTQAFFCELLAHRRIEKVDRAKGKFRSFLLASLKHFVANEWDKARAVKRGGKFEFVPIDTSLAEERFVREGSLGTNPDQVFDRSWATTLLEGVLGRLRAEYIRDGKGPLFEALQIYISSTPDLAPYAEVQSRLGLGTSAVKMSVLRLRRRFGELLREEIAHTVGSREEVNEEIRALFAAVSQ